jgi:hypothetical protein
LIHLKKKFVILSIVLLSSLYAFPQKDTTSVSNDSVALYYSDQSDLLALRLYLLLKFNTIDISKNDKHYILAPNSPTSIGVGFNFKGLGLALGIGLPRSSKSLHKYGSTTRLDIQMSIYSRLIGGDAYFQLYKGYYNTNPEDFITWDKDYYPKIPDMESISIGANIYYVLNHKKFSNKAAYSRTQVQLKSAGSVALGYFLNYDEVDSPNGFIPAEYPDSIGNDFDVKSFMYFATGISVGYMYTWVISKSFFLNGSLIPGFGYKNIRLTDGAGESGLEQQPHAQLSIRGALGYENKQFYAGLTGMTLIRNIKYKDYNIDLATEQVRFIIGKRFGVGKK